MPDNKNHMPFFDTFFEKLAYFAIIWLGLPTIAIFLGIWLATYQNNNKTAPQPQQEQLNQKL